MDWSTILTKVGDWFEMISAVLFVLWLIERYLIWLHD